MRDWVDARAAGRRPTASWADTLPARRLARPGRPARQARAGEGRLRHRRQRLPRPVAAASSPTPRRCSATTTDAERYAALAETQPRRVRRRVRDARRAHDDGCADRLRARARVRPRDRPDAAPARSPTGSPSWCAPAATASAPASSARRSSRTPSPTAGYLDAAERLLLQTECPSWLYPVTMGATTVWERWDSLLADGSVNPGEMTSFNHYALGAVADWLHRTVAGLAPDEPGYAPHPHRPPPARASSSTPRHGTSRRTGRHPSPGVATGSSIVVTRRGARRTRRRSSTCPASTSAIEVGSGSHEWTFGATGRRARSRGPLPGSTRPLADVIDDPRAYRALLDTLAAHDPGEADAVRATPCGRDGRTVRQCADVHPAATLLAKVDAAVRAATILTRQGSPMFDRASTFGEALDSPAARSVLEVFLPGIAASPMAVAVPRRAPRPAREPRARRSPRPVDQRPLLGGARRGRRRRLGPCARTPPRSTRDPEYEADERRPRLRPA